jgi:hypothetical protein
MSAPVSFAFTIAEVADEGLIAAKRITRNPDGSIWKSHYDKPVSWRFTPVVEDTLEDMAWCLRILSTLPRRCALMGSPVAGLDLSKPHRRLFAESLGPARTLTAPARSWAPLDFDDVVVPAGLGRAAMLREAALYVRDFLLPPEFHGVRMIAVPSASTGLKGEDTARLRIFVAFDREFSLRALKDWALGSCACDALHLDSAPIQGGQPIYTARPVFTGMRDLVPSTLRAVILDGDRDTVSLDVNRYAAKALEIRAKVGAARAACRENWKQLMVLTVGGDVGFFVPLTQGIGSAVKAAAGAEEIERFVAALLAQRADPGRRRAYGAKWVRRSIKSFQRRDKAARRAAIESFPRENSQ